MMKKLILSLTLVALFIGASAQTLPNIWVPTSGTNTYAVNVLNFTGSYNNKIAFVRFTNTNSGASTININGGGPAQLRKWDGSAWVTLSANDIKTDRDYRISYDNTNTWFRLEIVGAGSGSGDLLAANNLSDLASASTARTNLGLGTLATQSGTFSGTSSGTNTGDQTLNSLLPTQTGNSGKYLTTNGTNSSWATVAGGGGDALVANPLSQFAATTSAQLAGVISDETGSGASVFATSPTLVTPVLGTPTSVTLTNANGLPLTTGVTGTLPIANGGTGTTMPGIVAGTNISVTGTWPNQTVNNSLQKVLLITGSDEVTPISTGVAKVTFRMPYAMTLSTVYAELTTAQTSGSIFTVDVKKNGTTIFTTKVTIDNTEDDSFTAAIPYVLSTTALALRDKMTVDVFQTGDGTAKGFKVTLLGN